jgi:S-adenosylmethionine:tRNA ribosyltransferase-isomerase
MKPAAWPRDDPRLLVVGEGLEDASVAELPRFLGAGDLVVVNDAATLPASLSAISPSGRAMEVRLAGERASGTWRAVLLGEGDWRTRTEDRAAPEAIARGGVLSLAPDLHAVVERVSSLSPRLVEIRFDRDGDALVAALYRLGRPIQYAHVAGPLESWHVQTRYGGLPWAAEAPSAGLPLTWKLLLSLRRAGIGLAALTHAAGLSATGDPILDAALPLPERSRIPEETVHAIERAKRGGGRIVAVGTSVVRALEGRVASAGELAPGDGETDLFIGAGFRRQVLDALLTGLHEAGTSHFALCEAFADEGRLRFALAHAEGAGWVGHEFGDACLVFGTPTVSKPNERITARTYATSAVNNLA